MSLSLNQNISMLLTLQFYFLSVNLFAYPFFKLASFLLFINLMTKSILSCITSLNNFWIWLYVYRRTTRFSRRLVPTQPSHFTFSRPRFCQAPFIKKRVSIVLIKLMLYDYKSFINIAVCFNTFPIFCWLSKLMDRKLTESYTWENLSVVQLTSSSRENVQS
jgi:hypothetical protein